MLCVLVVQGMIGTMGMFLLTALMMVAMMMVAVFAMNMLMAVMSLTMMHIMWS